MEKFKELEAIVKKAVREALEEAGSEEARRIAEALDKLVTYTFTGFNKILEVLEKHSKILEEHTKILEEHSKILEEHSKILEKHSKILEEHTKILTRIEATLGGLTSRMGIDMERMILNVYKDVFEREGLEIRKVEKISFKDVDGRYYRRGAKLELDIYAHDDKVYFMEVKSLVDVNDIEWFNFKCEIFEKILGRRPDRRIIVCINILDEALERARELGVDIIYGRIIKAEEN
ncbi:MAG: DUF3782 domain-containing protein [Desulfurococcales archaeon]|jgi:hypothetical protein